MLTAQEIKQFIDEDKASFQKRQAKIGLDYYESNHDIKEYKIYYYNKDGVLVEDKNKANMQIPHSFFTELIDQKVQYALSQDEPIIKSDLPELQKQLDTYFDDDFIGELSDVLTYGGVEGNSYLYAFKNEDDRLQFEFAEGLGIVEVEARFASDGQDHILYWYVDKIDKEGHKIIKIQDWDKDYTYFYTEIDGKIKPDIDVTLNPRPHTVYFDEKGKMFYDTFGFIPFFKYENNKKEFSDLKPIKELIDDYDLMACGLSNNLIDLSEGYFCVKGFQGDNIDELIGNLKARKGIGVDDNGDVEIKTVDIPYQARQTKMELDEKNIYRFGMGFNSAQLGDGNITNVVIKSRYALLDLKCNKCAKQLKKMLKEVVKVVIAEINELNNTAYTIKDVYFNLDDREVITNANDNAQIELVEAQTQQTKITTLLNIQTLLDNETLMQNICDILDIDYEMIKDQLPVDDTEIDPEQEGMLNNIVNAPTEPVEETPIEE
jgi:SPP1 family phage portal protein